MDSVTGTITTYNPTTGEGLITLDIGEDPVHVDLKSSDGIWLRQGLRVQFSRVHRREGIFARYIKLI